MPRRVVSCMLCVLFAEGCQKDEESQEGRGCHNSRGSGSASRHVAAACLTMSLAIVFASDHGCTYRWLLAASRTAHTAASMHIMSNGPRHANTAYSLTFWMQHLQMAGTVIRRM